MTRIVEIVCVLSDVVAARAIGLNSASCRNRRSRRNWELGSAPRSPARSTGEHVIFVGTRRALG